MRSLSRCHPIHSRALRRCLSCFARLVGSSALAVADVAERTPVTLTLKQGLPITTTLEKVS
jgi:hypothetical protein